MARFVILDLDGTLYDSRARQHLAQAGLWDEFHSAASLDLPNADILELAQVLDAAGYSILACTGRNEKWRSQTTAWLLKHQVPITKLLMRPDNNYNPDTEVKLSLIIGYLDTLGYSRKDIAFALDDRDKVVDGFRSAGINCYQVRAGAF